MALFYSKFGFVGMFCIKTFIFFLFLFPLTFSFPIILCFGSEFSDVVYLAILTLCAGNLDSIYLELCAFNRVTFILFNNLFEKLLLFCNLGLITWPLDVFFYPFKVKFYYLFTSDTAFCFLPSKSL